MSNIKDFFKTLRFRVFVLVFLSITIAIIAFSLLSIRVMNSNVESVMTNDLIKSAELVDNAYQSRLESFFDSGSALSKDREFTALVYLNTEESKTKIKEKLIQIKNDENIDVATIIDLDGKVIIGANEIEPGTTVNLNGIIPHTYQNKVPILSTEILPNEYLKAEDESLATISKIKKIPSIENENPYLSEEYNYDALAQIAIIPIYQNSQLIGGLILADVINRDLYFPIQVNEKTNLQTINYDFAIFQKDIIVTTNIVTDKGTPYIGVQMAPKPSTRLMNEKLIFFEECIVKDHLTKSVFIPIKNYKSEVVGALMFGIPKEKFMNYQFSFTTKEFHALIIIISMVLLLIALYVAFIISGILIKPINQVIKSLDETIEGDYNQGVALSKFEEFNGLIKRHNSLIRDVRFKLKNKNKK